MNVVSNDSQPTGFDRAAAVTRSLLGYGVIAGPIYVVVGLVQALVRDGFDLSRHSLSLLANGPWGWVQITNLIVTGLMAVAAAVGLARAMRPSRWVGRLVATYGACLVLGGIFVADPTDGFPPGTPDGVPESASLSGIMHLAAGAIGFLALGIAYLLLGRWFAQRGDSGPARGSRLSGIIVLAGFIGGAALATTSAGVLALWIAVLAGWAWLAIASVAVYRTVPHPDACRD
jgi:hypothetical membrane protein